MAYFNFNFGQLLHKLNNVEIKNNIKFCKKIKKQFFLANYGIIFYKKNIYTHILFVLKIPQYFNL